MPALTVSVCPNDSRRELTPRRSRPWNSGLAHDVALSYGMAVLACHQAQQAPADQMVVPIGAQRVSSGGICPRA